MTQETIEDSCLFNIDTISDLFNMDMAEYCPEMEIQDTITDTFILAKTSEQKLTYYQNNQLDSNTINMILRPIKETTVLYASPEQEWKDKVNDYIQSTKAFSFIGPMSSETSNKHVENIFNQIETTIHELYISQALTNEHYKQMLSFKQLGTFEVNKLDFDLTLYEVSLFFSLLLHDRFRHRLLVSVFV